MTKNKLVDTAEMEGEDGPIEDGFLDDYSLIDEEDIPEEDIFDPENLETLADILEPARETYYLQLTSRKYIKVEFFVQGQAAAAEAMSGMRLKGSSKQLNAKTEKTAFLNRINPAMLNVKFVDTGKRKIKPYQDKDGKTVIALNVITTHGWNGLTERVFPGTHETSEDIQARANASRRRSMRDLPGPGNSN